MPETFWAAQKCRFWALWLERMKDEYPDSDEFGTAFDLALTSELGHYSIQDGWLLYKSRLCVTSTFSAAVLHNAHDSCWWSSRHPKHLGEAGAPFLLATYASRPIQVCAVMSDMPEGESFSSKGGRSSSATSHPGWSVPGYLDGFCWDRLVPDSQSHRHTMCLIIVDRFNICDAYSL